MASSKFPSSFDSNTEFYEESRFQKFTRRLREEPLIPVGCAATCYALFRASRSIRAGDHKTTNRMFRHRIYAQGFTIVCMVAGSYYYAEEREKRKTFESAVSERKAVEKKEAWIRELEARDQEEKDFLAMREAARKAKDERSAAPAVVDKDDTQPKRPGVLDAVKGLVR